MNKYITKDSGKRKQYPDGMHRDITEGKPRPDLIPLNVWQAILTAKLNHTQNLNDAFVDFWANPSWHELVDMLINVMPLIPNFLTRFGALLERGAKKYTENNWMKANSEEEMNHFKQSSFRHFAQFLDGDTDEDHALAAFGFNPMGYLHVKDKLVIRKSLLPLSKKK